MSAASSPGLAGSGLTSGESVVFSFLSGDISALPNGLITRTGSDVRAGGDSPDRSEAFLLSMIKKYRRRLRPAWPVQA